MGSGAVMSVGRGESEARGTLVMVVGVGMMEWSGVLFFSLSRVI